jgi:hypothetical protein
MEKNNLENIFFYVYPKSENHKITLTKKNIVSICDLSSNCSELNFSISKNKFNENKIFDNEKSNIENFASTNYIYNNLNLINLMNYDLILFSLIIVLFIVLKLRNKN